MMDTSGIPLEKPMIIKTNMTTDNRDRGPAFMSPKPQQGILAKPTSTANTWLGKRAKQQQQQHEVSCFYDA